MQKTVLITGATGFLGRHLCLYFHRKGYAVRALVRNFPKDTFAYPGVVFFRGNLPDEIDTEGFNGVDVLIHCAYTTRFSSQEEAYQVNHLGTLKVRALRAQFGIGQFVFISSTGAHADAESYYGKSKYALEQCMDLSRDLIIRPGLIIGSGTQGTFNRMKESMRRFAVVPIFDGGRQILQTIHLDDLCVAIGLAVEKRLVGVFVAAEHEGLSMRAFLKLMAARMQIRCLLLPLPLSFTLLLLKMLETLHIPFPLTTENLLGLKQMRHMPSLENLARIGITVKSAEQSLKICPM